MTAPHGSNLIVGISYELFPGFVAAARTQRARPVVPMAALAVPTVIQPIVFGVFNTGAAALVLGLFAERSLPVQLGATLLAGAGVLYAIAAGRTLLFAMRDPPRDPNPLSVLP